jgi:hypothetical protein
MVSNSVANTIADADANVDADNVVVVVVVTEEVLYYHFILTFLNLFFLNALILRCIFIIVGTFNVF